MGKGIDSAKMKEFFVKRGEYVGLALAVVLCGLLVYGAVGVPKYERTPDDLKKDYGAANVVFEKSDERLNLASEGIKLPGGSILEKIKQLLLAPVDPASFAGMEWNIPLFDTKSRRSEPQYLALTDLQAQFHYGAIDMKVGGAAPGANNNVVRRPLGEEWLCVTGLVPFEAQEAAYAEAFKGALDSRTNSVPKYLPYQIQRAEVVSADPAVPVDWDNMPNLELKTYVVDEMNKWAGTGTEYADRMYVQFPPLTQPLPPLTNKDYGDWCIHPEVPAAPAAPQQPAATARATVPAVAAASPNDPFGQNPAPEATPTPAPVANAATGTPTKPKYLLFRFLDFNIEPTKFYRYRVKLILANPNYKLDPSHLEKKELADGESREAAWSEPSAPVGMPVLERYFAGEGKSVGGDQEPDMSFAVKQWAPNFAADIYYEFKNKLRGALLNDPQATVVHKVPGGNGPATQSTNFVTDVLLADFSWEKTENRLKGPGSALEARTVNKPSEILVRTPRGELFIQTQLGDWPLRDEVKAIQAGEPANPAPGAAAAPPAGEAPAGDDVKRILKLK